ncbi:MAG: TIGR03084 family metal-binding protein [Parvibaculales bacterium]
MLQEAFDFRDESGALFAIMKDLPDAAFAVPTQFKGWTLTDVLQHLHVWNVAAYESYADEAKFDAFLKAAIGAVSSGSLRPFERDWLDNLSGRALLTAWHDFYVSMADAFSQVDPKKRLKWAGPDMSARSSISARLMETWAHGQEIFDHLGVVRTNRDTIRSIAVLGVNTFNWTYKVRGETPPETVPYVKLTSPSGADWVFGDDNTGESIEGAAEDFCMVVTQVRNIADVDLTLTGAVAQDWMSKAQCFAGPPETPPAPGTRFTIKR